MLLLSKIRKKRRDRSSGPFSVLAVLFQSSQLFAKVALQQAGQSLAVAGLVQ